MWQPYEKHTMQDYLRAPGNWPAGFFERHTAEELGITENERQQLIYAQNFAKSVAEDLFRNRNF